MPKKETAVDACLPRAELLLALRAMARKGAVAHTTATGGQIVLEIMSDKSELNPQHVTLSNEEWLAAHTAGWVTTANDQTQWRLTRRGRLDVKRALSRTPDAPKTNQAGVNVTPMAPQLTTPRQCDSESPLAWLAKRKDKSGCPFLANHEVDAGERLRADMWHAQMTPRVTSNWNFSGDGSSRRSPTMAADIATSVSAAQERVREALSAVGPDASNVLVDVCCHLQGLEILERNKGWPKRSAKIVLKFALGLLARHYGLVPTAQQAGKSVRPLHWGSHDYRPSIDGTGHGA